MEQIVHRRSVALQSNQNNIKLSTTMFFHLHSNKQADGEAERARRKQQMAEARRHVTEELVAAMALPEGERLVWNTTVADLMAAAHIAYAQGTVCDDRGRTPTFTELAATVCKRFGRRKPANPWAAVYQAEQRKSAATASFIERYRFMMVERGMDNPLASHFISRP